MEKPFHMNPVALIFEMKQRCSQTKHISIPTCALGQEYDLGQPEYHQMCGSYDKMVLKCHEEGHMAMLCKNLKSDEPTIRIMEQFEPL